jgi:hypothetical protein
MTSLPQTHPRTSPAQEGRRRTWPANDVAGAPESSGAARGRARQMLPAVEPSVAYGCVDWFLYPQAKPARAQAYQDLM